MGGYAPLFSRRPSLWVKHLICSHSCCCTHLKLRLGPKRRSTSASLRGTTLLPTIVSRPATTLSNLSPRLLSNCDEPPSGVHHLSTLLIIACSRSTRATSSKLFYNSSLPASPLHCTGSAEVLGRQDIVKPFLFIPFKYMQPNTQCSAR